MEGDTSSQLNQQSQSGDVNTNPGVVGPTPPDQSTLPPVQPSSNMPVSGGAKRGRKLGLAGIIALVAVLLLGGSAAAYFGFIVPNKPENVWKSALSNTADGYDELVDYANEIKDTKGFKAKGSLKLSGAVAGDGSIEAEGDEKNTKVKVDFGFAGARFNIDLLTTTPDGSKTPDMYIKAGGLQGVGDLLAGSLYSDLGPVINGLNDQWIFIDHTLLDQMFGQSQSNQPTITNEDIIVIAEKLGEVNREYLFSTDESRQVLTVAKEVGKEERDGRSVYHYEVGYHKENLKSYIRELKNRLKDTKFKDLIEASGQSYDEAFDIESTLREIDQLSGDETADVWVDMKTKLIRVVRFTEEENAENYVELRLPYNGGDEVPFVVAVNTNEEGEKGQAEFGISVNTDTNVSRLHLDVNYDVDGEKQTAKGDLTIEPSTAAVEFTKPEGAKSITEILGALYSGLGAGLDMSQSSDFGTDVPIGGLEL